MLKPALMTGLLTALLVCFGGCIPAGTGGEESAGFTDMLPMILFLVVIFALFYFVTIRPQRQRQKQHNTMVQALQKGDRVITAGGIYGTIESMDEDSLVLKIEAGTIRIARASVVGRREK